MVGELAELLSERENSTMSAENLTRFLDKIEAEMGYLEGVAKELATRIANQNQRATTTTDPVANTEKPWRCVGLCFEKLHMWHIYPSIPTTSNNIMTLFRLGRT